ncbi:hypothetical protein C5S32_03920 [ANME-1 cluster archaeon GoMg1]|nr:hypothetical protein [ANME-1 cluster archaeon GoMg1]
MNRDGLWDRLKGDAEAEREADKERRVTLVGAKLAKAGDEFIFLGLPEKCEECKLKKSCANLEVGRRYRIEHVRDEIKHDCYIHEDGVRVVEVTEPPLKVAIDAKHAVKGAKIVFNPAVADYEESDLCHPTGLKEGDRCIILGVVDDAQGNDKMLKEWGLKLVEVKREGKKKI